ncbi:hypothetical protein TRM7557_00842 [Tritonibacter multivorans]|uniref:Endonuclease/exonuclease/phosphatase domain-containing protein n=1 Tax=Tritonibacter multivorans TaxID=928856 RepID=A0A0P1G3D9_9RHOB|nr:endonuclease/exonuclease/phosphatase family protein [Tritonibacter multivorans]MDA7422537.1 endonuclease/exonuclease/phosphatase family protein [Tritonibacter multivorans]CUH76327.1 hypothetical protein TRM7557_00842 [Tritonibacter multivorans]SFD39720.1 Endonuclease/Exonuclease/phosphatase family protein [Tritonibacter multivorans]
MRCRAASLLGAFLIFLSTVAAWAEPLRIATFHTELSRKGPGILVRDLEQQKPNPQIEAVIATLVEAQPDIVLLQGIDWDMSPRVAEALSRRLSDAGLPGMRGFARQPNAGFPSGVDLDGDGQTNGPGDSYGWGRFSGQGGMLLLSRLPIDETRSETFSDLLWRNLPDHQMPRHPDGSPFPSARAWEVWRLSSVGLWAVPITLPDGRDLWLLGFHAAPPVFDGPEDRNGRRNADEIRLWRHVLDGTITSAVTGPLVLAGSANLDPVRGDGRHAAIRDLLAHPKLQDPQPRDGAGNDHTVTWEHAGDMRVDYVLPASQMTVIDSGILRSAGSRHGLVWVDILP